MAWRSGLLTIIAFLALLSTAACRPGQPDTLAVVERLPVPGAPPAGAWFVRGALWLSVPGGLVMHVPTTGETVAVPLPGQATPTILGTADDLLFVHSGGAILSITLGDNAILATAQDFEFDAFAVDPGGRFLLRSMENGSIIAHDARTLEALWGWGSIGAGSEALTVSPEGGRLYQGVGAFGDRAPQLLVRDLQTGRTLRSVELAVTPRWVAVRGSTVLVAGWEGRTGVVAAFKWTGGELTPRWSQSFGQLGTAPPALVHASGDGGSIALLGMNEEAGLHVLDVETGESVDRLRGEALGLAFDEDDRLYLLLTDGVARVD